MDDKRTITKNEFILLSAGEYSDYCPVALCKAKQDINILDALRDYRVVLAQKDDYYEQRFTYWKFARWLIADQKLLREITYREWHIDDSDPELMEGLNEPD